MNQDPKAELSAPYYLPEHAHFAVQAEALSVCEDLLRRLNEWDHFDSASDGPYWRAEIAKALTQVHLLKTSAKSPFPDPM